VNGGYQNHWASAWGEDFGALSYGDQMADDANFSVSPVEMSPGSNVQGYGEPIAIASLIIGGLSLIGGGVATGISVARQAKERRLLREGAKKQRATRKLELLRAATQRRSSESQSAIAASRKKMAAVRSESQKQRGGAIIFPAVLALGIFGYIAFKSSK
jgi:hypothetical protein|tara:strand:- start:788 stop:1264 length:477 start_codon:yes stop_codon:yes gene_type:complete